MTAEAVNMQDDNVCILGKVLAYPQRTENVFNFDILKMQGKSLNVGLHCNF